MGNRWLQPARSRYAAVLLVVVVFSGWAVASVVVRAQDKSGVPTSAPTSASASTSTATATGRAAAEADAAGVVWLCMPGATADPCAGNLDVTSIDPAGKQTAQPVPPANNPPVDCFYVYPTTSRQKTVNADLSIDPEEVGVAVAQAAPFSQVCNVYAPIYPQATIEALNSGQIDLNVIETAYEGVRAAFADYLANYNHGRGVVLIGHSQGAMMLVGLLHRMIDVDPAVRRLLVSALLMGANVTVPVGRTVGGDFANIPACGSISQTGCVVAYSSFDTTPPAGAAFGRVPGLTMFQFAKDGPQQILCVNPAAPAGGAAVLKSQFVTADVAKLAGAPTPLPATRYVSYSNSLSGECRTDGDGSWLQVARTGSPGTLPALAGSEGPSWGLHDLDVSLTLGNLVDLVRTESAAYR
jgi:hypothetical protein